MYNNYVGGNLIWFSMSIHAGLWCFVAGDHRCFVADEG